MRLKTREQAGSGRADANPRILALGDGLEPSILRSGKSNYERLELKTDGVGTHRRRFVCGSVRGEKGGRSESAKWFSKPASSDLDAAERRTAFLVYTPPVKLSPDLSPECSGSGGFGRYTPGR